MEIVTNHGFSRPKPNENNWLRMARSGRGVRGGHGGLPPRGGEQGARLVEIAVRRESVIALAVTTQVGMGIG